MSPRTLERLCGDVSPTAEQRAAAAEWLGLLEAGKLAEERTNHPRFMRIILEGILGYGSDDIAYERGNVEFQYAPRGRTVACFEVKGTETADLFAPQHRAKKEHYTPIKQTWDYMGSSGAEYGICSNYRHFVLITRRFGYARYYMFDFEGIRKDPDRLREFVGVFSKGRMEGGFVERAHDESASEERELTEEFYDLYGRTRLMLVKEFEASGDDRAGAVARAQGFLNRLIFIFFVEDSGLSGRKDMFIDGVVDMLGGAVTRGTSRVWNYIVHELFEFYRVGCEDPRVFAFNSGLFDGGMGGPAHFPDRRRNGFFDEFRPRVGRRSWEFKEKVRDAVGAHGDVNPVIKNLLSLASYDFRSQIRVTILGHIFENSVSDLEEMLGGRESRRKRDGIYYTPQHVTRYICLRTIVPLLSRSGSARDPQDLVAEYAGDLDELDRRLDGIRILDPACGSGAFLIEAATTLLEIHDEMRRHREAAGNGNGNGNENDNGNGGGGASDRNTLDPSIRDARARRIATECLYGIDINPQSVKIARLSLFLLTASAGESLPDLSSRIVAADSIVPAAGRDWEDMFAGVFSGDNPGFSAIVGNPPYVRQEAIRGDKGAMQLRRHPRRAPLDLPDGFEIPRNSDLSAYFYVHSIARLRRGGRLGFISSDGWMRAGYGAALQRVLLDNTAIDTVAAADFKVFGDADVNTAVVVAERGRPRPGHEVRLAVAGGPADFAAEAAGAGPGGKSVPQSGLEPGNWSARLAAAPVEAPFAEVPMADAGTVRFGTKTGHKAFFVLSAAEAERRGVPRRYLRPCVAGRGGPLLMDGDATEFLLDAPDEKGVLERTADGRALLGYIRRGEATEVETASGGRRTTVRLPDLPTLSARRPWYSLGLAGAPPSPIFLSRLVGSRIRVYENGGTYRSTNTHVSYTPSRKDHVRALSACLASAWFALHLERSANPMGGGALSIEVGNFARAPVPDLDALPEGAVRRLEGAWEAYCADADAASLDRTVLGALGFDAAQIETILGELGRLVRRRTGRSLAPWDRRRAAPRAAAEIPPPRPARKL